MTYLWIVILNHYIENYLIGFQVFAETDMWIIETIWRSLSIWANSYRVFLIR